MKWYSEKAVKYVTRNFLALEITSWYNSTYYAIIVPVNKNLHSVSTVKQSAEKG